MEYGDLPVQIAEFHIKCNEMMFYQYLPIKMIFSDDVRLEPRLECFDPIIRQICDDFIKVFGKLEYTNHYIYLTAKHQYQIANTSFNRMGYHSDGFMTDDINYIWSDANPTIFNESEFHLTLDDKISLGQMESQAMVGNQVIYSDNTILRLNQFNIHKVNESDFNGMRTFLKISFSKDKYDLVGNSHNYLHDYDWEMKSRQSERNIPQTIKK